MLTVATFNVHFGKHTDKIIKAIKENENLSKVDILLLQEIEVRAREEKERACRIADGLGMHWVYAPARRLNDVDTHGLAILSKYPILNFEVIQLEFFKLVRKSRTRIALNAEIQVGDEKILVSNVHLDTTLNFAARARQLYSLIGKLKEHQIQKIIVGGDLNTLPFRFFLNSFPYFYEDQTYKMYNFLREHGFDSLMEKLGYTIQAGPVKWSLDAIYIRNLEMKHFGVERDVRVSDHKPVWAHISLD
jgi:endonuclease/exonuclease/phosphatase family metal-dependent hydrolase